MGLAEHVAEIHNKKDHATSTLCLHAFSDLAHVPPVVFLYLLKECYFYGMISPLSTAK